MRWLLLAAIALWTAPCFAQWGKPLADLNAYKSDSNSLKNPYGAGSPYKTDGLKNPYSSYGSPYSNYSATNPYATNPPKIYSQSGQYHGELSANKYLPDSTSNKYGYYGSKYSSESINNPYGAGSPYNQSPLYVYPAKRKSHRADSIKRVQEYKKQSRARNYARLRARAVRK